MSNLLNTTSDRMIVIEAQRYLLRRRISRHWQRSLVIAWDEWRTTGNRFSLATLVNQLNNAHDTEIRELAELLGIVGGFTATIQDLSYWIDPVAGDDASGDGSQANPYKTLWFLDLLPGVIRHAVRVMVLADASGLGAGISDPINTSRFSFEGNGGFLSIIGVGVPHAISGPWTAAASANTGYTDGNGGLKIDVGGAVLVPKNFEHHFVRFLTGNLAGKAFPVLTNTDQIIYLPYTWIPVTAGETFDIVRPTPRMYSTITLGHSAPDYEPAGAKTGARVGIFNFMAETGNPTLASDFGLSISAPSVFSFATILTNGTSMLVRNTSINTTYTPDLQVNILSNTGLDNLNYDGIEMGSQAKLSGFSHYGNSLRYNGDSRIQSGVTSTIEPAYTDLSSIWMERIGYEILGSGAAPVRGDAIVRSSIQSVEVDVPNNFRGSRISLHGVSLISVHAALGAGAAYFRFASLGNFFHIVLAAADVSTLFSPDYAVMFGSATEAAFCNSVVNVDPVANGLVGGVNMLFSAFPASVPGTWPALPLGIAVEATYGLWHVQRGIV
jgi:hypothetical protein